MEIVYKSDPISKYWIGQNINMEALERNREIGNRLFSFFGRVILRFTGQNLRPLNFFSLAFFFQAVFYTYKQTTQALNEMPHRNIF